MAVAPVIGTIRAINFRAFPKNQSAVAFGHALVGVSKQFDLTGSAVDNPFFIVVLKTVYAVEITLRKMINSPGLGDSGISSKLWQFHYCSHPYAFAGNSSG